MSECTTCSYYGKHLEGPAERLPWPCGECEGGEMYVERGKRKHRSPLRIQLADAERRLAELVEAVRWERECFQDIRPLVAWADLYVRHGEDYVDSVADDLRAIQAAARAAVDALVGEG